MAKQKEIPALFIRSLHEPYRRAGFAFSRSGVGIALSALTDDQVKALKEDPHLFVEECMFPADSEAAAAEAAAKEAAEKAAAEAAAKEAAEKAAAEAAAKEAAQKAAAEAAAKEAAGKDKAKAGVK